MDIGVKIRELRRHVYKENSRDFAKRCDISKSCLLQIERGEIIKPTRKVLNKLEKALDLDFRDMNKTNGTVIFTKSQKITRFRNVLNSIYTDMNKNILFLNSLCNEELYMRDDKFLDEKIDDLIRQLEAVRTEIKKTCIETKEEKAYHVIDDLFINMEVETVPPRKKKEERK